MAEQFAGYRAFGDTDNLYYKSGEMEQYKGFVVSEIDPITGVVTFTNGDTTVSYTHLEVLKLLQETYLGKVKMIYIDPPYNTGNDFVYEDDFAQRTEDYMENSGQYDEEGNRMVTNTESNGRFHTDWLNMIYPRLKLAKDLLAEDGVIFISKMCIRDRFSPYG